jgi:two-component system chemotaxis response regulator CheB
MFKKIKVLVVDDTIVYRKAVSDVLAEIPNVEVVGVAHNGKIAMSKIKSLKPDLLTLDIEMPEMNGIEVLQQIQNQKIPISCIMISTLTTEGGEMTMKALELGAFDFILKPAAANITKSKDLLRKLLIPLIKEFQKGQIKTVLSPHSSAQTRILPTAQRSALKSTVLNRPLPSRSLPGKIAALSPAGKSEIITIGISTGGPNALNRMLPMLPKDIGVPIVIVQHMPALFTKSLAESLNKKCALTIKEAEEGEPLKPNYVYIAPGGKQTKLIAAANGIDRLIKITNDAPENSCKPSADYLFRSIADYYVGRATAVIMTGMGSDGTKGLVTLKKKGAYIIAQNKESCVVYGMPKAPADMGIVDVIAPLDSIANEILKTI